MTPAEALLADLASRGIELQADGDRVRWRPRFMVSGPWLDRIRAERASLIALLSGPDCLERCPTCRWPLDAVARCVKCRDRLCVDCGRLTGSYFIQSCVSCGHAFREEQTS